MEYPSLTIEVSQLRAVLELPYQNSSECLDLSCPSRRTASGRFPAGIATTRTASQNRSQWDSYLSLLSTRRTSMRIPTLPCVITWYRSENSFKRLAA